MTTYTLKDYYPRPYQKQVFAIRTFDDNWRETEYTVPDLGTPPVKFDPPRTWGERELFRIKLDNGYI